MVKMPEAARLSREVIGGKAVRLARMLAEGFPVKQFVVLDVPEIRYIVDSKQVPTCSLDELLQVFGSTEPGVAVRSSAVSEDGALSWAGQFESILFVQPESLRDSILKCAAALDSDNVRSYAASRGADLPELAIVIQEMVDAELSGVLFTRHPLASDDSTVIEVVHGVADDFVSGRVEPRRYYLQGIRLTREEGNPSVRLTEEQLTELVEMSFRLRDLFGAEQDIEWAIERGTGKLWLNQSRDITTLPDGQEIARMAALVQAINTDAVAALRREDERIASLGCGFKSEILDVLSDQNIAEILTPHPSQMGFGLFTYGFAHGDGAIRNARNAMGYDIGEELERGFFRLVGGQPRCSIIHDAFTYRIRGIPISDYCAIVDYYLDRIREDPQMANYPEVVLYNQSPSREFLVRIFGEEKANEYMAAYRRFFSGIQVQENVLAAQCSSDFLPRWDAEVARVSRLGLDDADVADMINLYREICDLLRNFAFPMFVRVARLGFFVYARLRNLLTELFGEKGKAYLDILTGGISLELNPNLEFSAQLYRLNRGGTTLAKLVERYGHLGSHELEISVPRYRDQPELMLGLAEKIATDPVEDLGKAQSQSISLRRELLACAGERATELDREIRTARTYLPLREVVKFQFLRGYDLLRTLACRINTKVGWEEGLIFNLDPKEVFVMLGREEELRALAVKRKAERESFSQVDVSPVMTVNRSGDVVSSDREGSDTLLKGIGVTDVVSEGEVVVIRNLTDRDAIARLVPGCVLVTVTTDPAWSPVLSVIGSKGGLVTEIGGLLAHGAIYARENGIAAVLNVQRATEFLKTGMRARVNGRTGTVEVLK